MNISLLAFAALATGVVSAPALAAPKTVLVRTSDLNLASQAGRERPARRIDFAAESVCVLRGDMSLVSRIEGRKCIDFAVSTAWQKADLIAGRVIVAGR